MAGAGDTREFTCNVLFYIKYIALLLTHDDSRTATPLPAVFIGRLAALFQIQRRGTVVALARSLPPHRYRTRRSRRLDFREFQLGESGKGRRLLDQAARFAVERGQPEYWQALRLFVKEEQRHSRMLGRFLELHGVPPLDRHRVNSAFRSIRGLAGPELRMRVLATAEVLAMPYYLALREATASPLLQAICGRILEEEAMHLQFQAFTFRLFQGARPAILRCLTWIANRILLAGAEAVLWREHRAVFRAAGYSRKRLADEAARWFAELGWA
jgi:hypothetical protein